MASKRKRSQLEPKSDAKQLKLSFAPLPRSEKTEEPVSVQGFNPDWKREFPWVRHDEKEKKMFCMKCEEAAVNSKAMVFVSGCVNLRKFKYFA